MGFCFFNNIAIAANYAKLKYKIKKCAVIDFDVHHGNGTQKMFWNDPNMFYASTHQEGIFPGTGFKEETGINNNIVNVPLPAGTDSSLFKKSYEEVIFPSLEQFSPDIIFISAGFDAHVDDPLGGMRLTVEGYGTLTRLIYRLALEHCDGRVVIVTEGGYHLPALESCLEEILVVTGEQIHDLQQILPVSGPTDVAEAALGPILLAQTPYWPSISTSAQL